MAKKTAETKVKSKTPEMIIADVVYSRNPEFRTFYGNRVEVVSTDWDVYITFFQCIEAAGDSTGTKLNLEENCRITMTHANFASMFETMTRAMKNDPHLKAFILPEQAGA